MPLWFINQYDITTDAADPWAPSDLTAAPSNGTVLQGEPPARSGVMRGLHQLDHYFDGAVRVNDASVSQYILCPSITSTTLPAVKLGKAYSTTVSATGGPLRTPGAWSPEASRPACTCPSSGLISGTPTAAGAFSVVVQVNRFISLAAQRYGEYRSQSTGGIAGIVAESHAAQGVTRPTLLAKGGQAPTPGVCFPGTLPTGLTSRIHRTDCRQTFRRGDIHVYG